MNKIIINVQPDGTTQFIYHDQLRPLLNNGGAQVKRASAVEPGDPTRNQDPLSWYSDMEPSGQQVVLGPFTTRQAALDAEVEWLNDNLLSCQAQTLSQVT